MFCKKCGARIDDESLFCEECGARVAGKSSNSIARRDADIQANGSNADKQQLIKYLEVGVELEKQKYLQERTLKILKGQINNLGIRKNYRKPDPPKGGSFYYDGDYAGSGFGIGAVLGLIVFGISCAGNGCTSWGVGGTIGRLVGMPVIGGIIGLIGSLIVAIIIAGKSSRDKEKSYQEAINTYNCNISADSARVAQELKQKAILIEEGDKLYQQYLSTKKTLEVFYSKNIIYRKYQNDFVAIASFLDYFKSGRCSTLGENRGGDGAYNTYESELRMNRIISKLDDILLSLEDIKANQWEIVNAIERGNAISSRLVEETNRLAIAGETAARNSAIAAYSSQEAASELNQIKWLEIFKSF